MYPRLTAPLLGCLAVVAVLLLWTVVRRPVLRRLALRQVARRPLEAALVVTGSVLGTAIIVAALVVGDTLGLSVRQTAYRTLGPMDERVVSSSTQLGDQVAARLQPLAGTAEVDGVLSARVQQAAAARSLRDDRLAEPRVFAWEVDFAAAAEFGAAGGPSGLGGAPPSAGEIVVNAALARSLDAREGTTVTLYLAGAPREFVVARVVPDRGIAGTGFGANINRNAFLPPGSLASAAAGESAVRSVTWVSNRGDVEAGDVLTEQVAARIRAALGPLYGQVAVDTPKKDVLKAADITGDTLGGLFLMIGSFSIIAGALLLVNVFVMLAGERRGQLGMLRAAGLKRAHLVGAFALEGAIYALVATAFGLGLGVLVGRGVAFVAGKIFSSWTADGSTLDITFGASFTSLVNGAGLGLVIAFATIVATAARISRFNIIAAIRDLDVAPPARARRRLVVVATVGGATFAVAAVPAVAASDPIGAFLLPAAAVTCMTPLLAARFGRRIANSAASTAVLLWVLAVNLLRPAVYDTQSMALYVVMGSLLAFSGVVLLSENQTVLLRPVRRFVQRPSEGALAARLAVAYPVAKRFRTGATLSMYTLIVLVLVLLTQIGAVLTHSIDRQVADSTGGYGVRIDFNPDVPNGPLTSLQAGVFRKEVAALTPLTSARARSTDPGRRTDDPVDTLVVGVPAGSTSGMVLDERLPGLATDADVWAALAVHPEYVVLDPAFGSAGGPPGNYYGPGDTFAVTDPRTGAVREKTIVGILRNSVVFYSPALPAAFPLVTGEGSVREQFGEGAAVASALLRTTSPGAEDDLAARLQGSYLEASLVATALPSSIERIFDASLAFFRLMQAFLGLGLLIGITGLGVVMVRAVRERRRTIGILRALGFRSRVVERSFLLESGFVAVEGVVLGCVLGVLTTWLMYEQSTAFNGIRTGFPIEWPTLGGLVALTLAASLAATFGPARRAAGIRPALATRIAD